MRGRFNKAFGIKDDLGVEQRRFVERINQTAFVRVQELKYPITYAEIFRKVCYYLGTNAEDRIAAVNGNSYFATGIAIPSIRSLTRDEFTETLRVLELLYEALAKAPREQEAIGGWIEAAFSHCTVDLGVSWKDGMFYPSGAQDLDQSLIEEPWEWLADFPPERADLLKALTAYRERRLDEVITNCYLAVEGIAREVLGNKRTLDNNREELLKRVGLSQEWKSLLSNFIIYANEFKRHASDQRHKLNPVEVEGFLYLSGLILRMVIRAGIASAG